MELRRYLDIIWRRAWLVAGLLALTALISLVWRPQSAPPLYQASFRVTLGLAPEQTRAGDYTYDRYYTWLTSEYVTDSFAEIVKSQSFADDVSRRLQAAGVPLTVPAGAIQGATNTDQQHRILTIHMSWGNADDLALIANAAVATLQEDNAKYFSQLGTDGASVYVIDPPSIAPAPASLRSRLDLPIRLFLALLAGIALAFLLDYLDVTVRNAAEVEAAGLPVLGQIPRGRRRYL